MRVSWIESEPVWTFDDVRAALPVYRRENVDFEMTILGLLKKDRFAIRNFVLEFPFLRNITALHQVHIGLVKPIAKRFAWAHGDVLTGIQFDTLCVGGFDYSWEEVMDWFDQNSLPLENSNTIMKLDIVYQADGIFLTHAAGAAAVHFPGWQEAEIAALYGHLIYRLTHSQLDTPDAMYRYALDSLQKIDGCYEVIHAPQ